MGCISEVEGTSKYKKWSDLQWILEAELPDFVMSEPCGWGIKMKEMRMAFVFEAWASWAHHDIIYRDRKN
jgi:hypothetical protein